jgi:putative ABC transport system permease protein
MTVRIVSLRENLFYVAQPVLFVLVGAAAFVLLIVCANLASLLLARGSERERELAIRTALGASRGRLARQLMLESLLIAVIGGGCGLLLANATFDLIYALVPGRVYRIIPAGIDYRVVVFATLSSLCAGLLFGVAPAQRLSKPDILPSLQQGKGLSRFGAGSWQTGTLLVASETALVVVLLAGAGLMVNSFARLLRVDLGVNPDRVDILTVSLPRTRYPRLAAFQFDQQLLERVSALPDVDRAAGAVSAPLFGSLWMRLSLPDSPTASGTAEPVTAGYFRTFGIRLLAGRAFTDHEAMTNAPVAVLSESAARIGWPRGDALGSTFQNPRDQPRQIIGIVADIRQSVRQRAVPVMYMPFDAATFRSMTIAVRSREDPRAMAAMLKAQVRSLDPNLMATVSPFTEILDAQIAVPRFQTLLFSVFAVLGLILAAIGIFGVVGYTVARRTHEIGVRMALGADARDVMRMVIREALTPVAAGLGIGLIGAFWITRLLASWLFEVTPHDPATLTAVSLLLVGTALAATYFPARRASRVDPMEALRTE